MPLKANMSLGSHKTRHWETDALMMEAARTSETLVNFYQTKMAVF
jgi:hypothetical protein